MSTTHSPRRERRDHQLLLAARDGDVEALRRLARTWGPRVWRVAALVVGETAASQLTFEVFQVALAAPAPLPRPGDVRLHLFRHLYGLIAAAPPSESGLLGALPMPLRAFHALTQLEGFNYQQVASICDVDVAAVRDGCAAARDALVAEFGEFRQGSTDASPAPGAMDPDGSWPEPAA